MSEAPPRESVRLQAAWASSRPDAMIQGLRSRVLLKQGAITSDRLSPPTGFSSGSAGLPRLTQAMP
jgi:hypothetical protein